MPRYFFNIENGHKLIDPCGLICANDEDAIARAKVVANQVLLDKPMTDPLRHIAVLNHSHEEVSRVMVYSEPQLLS